MKAVLLMMATAAPAVAANEGREIFLYGQSSQPILMSLAGDASFTGGAVMPCAACHGAQGDGGPERAAVPDIARLAFTVADSTALARVLERGLGRDGRALQLMPRYALNAAQKSALANYVIALEAGNAPEPGVSDDAVIFDVSALSPAVRAELLGQSEAPGPAVYGRKIRFVGTDRESAFARIAPRPVDFIGDDRPTVPLATTGPEAGRVAVMLVTELLRRTGRRLNRPAFAASLDAMRRQEIER